jgi:hypothetical protein
VMILLMVYLHVCRISPVLAKDHHFFVPIGGSQLQTVIRGYHQLLLSATFTFTY